MTEQAPTISGPERDRVRPGPLLQRALHLFDGRVAPEGARRLGIATAVATALVSSVAAVATAAGALFLAGAGTAWLKENVEFFTHHPRLGAVVCYAVITLLVGTGVLIGRASARRPRDDR